MTYYSEKPSLDDLLGQVNDPDIPTNLADKIIAAATQLPQDDISDANIASEKLDSEPIAVPRPIALHNNRKYTAQPNVNKWRKIKSSAFLSNHSSSRAAIYIGGMVLLSSIAIGSFQNQNSSEHINSSAIANNSQNTSSSIAKTDIPAPSIATEILDTPPLNAGNIGKIAATKNIKSNDILNRNLKQNRNVIASGNQNNAANLNREETIASEKLKKDLSIEKDGIIINDDSLPNSGQLSEQSEIKTANVPDSVKNDGLDDIPIIVRKSESSPKSGTIIDPNKIEPRFGITDTPLQKPNTMPENDDSLSIPNTNLPATSPRLPFPNNYK